MVGIIITSSWEEHPEGLLCGRGYNWPLTAIEECWYSIDYMIINVMQGDLVTEDDRDFCRSLREETWSMANIQRRNPAMVIILSVITCGIYSIYWFVKTKEEINGLGAEIPTGWLLIIPIANLYFDYKYAEGFSIHVKKDDNAIVWFLLLFLVAPVAVILFQIELNKLAQ